MREKKRQIVWRRVLTFYWNIAPQPLSLKPGYTLRILVVSLAKRPP